MQAFSSFGALPPRLELAHLLLAQRNAQPPRYRPPLFNAGHGSVGGRVLPLTLKDVRLMLRSGYSSEAVQRELSERHLVEPCDAAAKPPEGSGRHTALIEAMKAAPIGLRQPTQWLPLNS